MKFTNVPGKQRSGRTNRPVRPSGNPYTFSLRKGQVGLPLAERRSWGGPW